MKALLIGLVIIILLIAGVAGYIFMQFEDLRVKYAVLKQSYTSLNTTFNKLREDYTSLTSKYEELSDRYGKLLENYTSLKNAYDSLSTAYSTLSTNYTSLKSSFNTLKEEYEGLKRSYNELLTNYSRLSSSYNALSKSFELLKTQYYDVLKRYDLIYTVIRDRAGLMDTLPKYIDYLSPEVSNAVTEAMKAWLGNPYTKIYNWVKSHVRYNYDTPLIVPNPINSSTPYFTFSNYVQYASETASLGRGDCEDQAILVAAMVLNYWLRTENKTYLIYVVIIAGYEKGGKGAAHAFTLIPIKGGKVIILDPAGSLITGLDLWIFRIVEPKDIYEAIKGYVDTWRNYGIHWTKIAAVFNQNTYERLDMSIDQFIKWLYEKTR